MCNAITEVSGRESGAGLPREVRARDPSVRLRAALAIGSRPDVEAIDALILRSAIEDNFYVRDMLTWALTRLPSELTMPRLLAELHSDLPQARSQSLHTLSKIKHPAAWPAITQRHLRDPDSEVARSAWRAAVVLAPHALHRALAAELASQLGRGDRQLQLSLSRALLTLGEEVVQPILAEILLDNDPLVVAHAKATLQLFRDPDRAFDLDIQEARLVHIISKER